MTREVAIKAIQDFIGWFKEDSLIRKALEMAIKTLSQEPKIPCDVCVYNPPSSTDGKPCCMCPATPYQKGGKVRDYDVECRNHSEMILNAQKQKGVEE